MILKPRSMTNNLAFKCIMSAWIFSGPRKTGLFDIFNPLSPLKLKHTFTYNAARDIPSKMLFMS